MTKTDGRKRKKEANFRNKNPIFSLNLLCRRFSNYVNSPSTHRHKTQIIVYAVRICYVLKRCCFFRFLCPNICLQKSEKKLQKKNVLEKRQQTNKNTSDSKSKRRRYTRSKKMISMCISTVFFFFRYQAVILHTHIFKCVIKGVYSSFLLLFFSFIVHAQMHIRAKAQYTCLLFYIFHLFCFFTSRAVACEKL